MEIEQLEKTDDSTKFVITCDTFEEVTEFKQLIRTLMNKEI